MHGQPCLLPFGQPYEPHTDPAPEQMRVLCGSVLCRLQFWSEAEWAELPESEWPVRSEHVPGIGWVGAVPVAHGLRVNPGS